MNIHGLLKNLEMRWVGDVVAAGATIDDNSARIDMTGYESALFVTSIKDSVATGVATLKVEHNDADSDTGMAAVTGAQAQATCAVNDDLNNKLLAVEVRPTKRYLQGVRTSLTANIAFGDILVFLKPLSAPVTQGATVQASALVGD